MPAKGKGQFQKGRQSKLRARFHDYNSQRRYNGESTVSWENYKKNTRNGTVRFSKGKS